ncbi:18094_t:CDS:2, partial [Gigaspora rosea]
MYQGKNSFIIENNSEKTKPLSRVRAKCACGPCRKSKKKCEGGIPNKKQCLRCEKSRGAKKCVYVIATGQQSDYNAIGVFTSDGAEYNVSDYIEQTLFWQSYPYS